MRTDKHTSRTIPRWYTEHSSHSCDTAYSETRHSVLFVTQPQKSAVNWVKVDTEKAALNFICTLTELMYQDIPSNC